MDEFYEMLTSGKKYVRYEDGKQPAYRQQGKLLCWEYNQTRPDETDRRMEILHKLLGSCPEFVMIQPPFQCDYGFNIHFHGFAVINFNCCILDTSPVHIGNGVFIAPGTVISCAGHAIHPEQRTQGLSTSAPITIEDDVWIGANCTICPGVTIGKGSVIGAGSVVVRDIPSNVVAFGVPCKVKRPITEADRCALELPKSL